jgi:hypothetical protein
MSTNGMPESNLPEPGEAKTVTNSTVRVKVGLKKLCESCQQLDLGVDKFVTYDGASKQPKKASGHSGHQSEFSLKSGNRTFNIGSFEDIYARSATCPFCFLTMKSVEVPALASVAWLAQCYVTWEIDGRHNDRTMARKARTRRLHLHWDHKDFKDSYLVFVAPQQLFDFNSDSQGSWQREAFFLGRELRGDGNNQVLMKSWLDQCHEHHGKACAGDYGPEFVDMADQSYFGVIDVLDMCLKSLPCRAPKAESRGPPPPSHGIVWIQPSGDRPHSPSSRPNTHGMTNSKIKRIFY